jgi:hypothetical protein
MPLPVAAVQAALAKGGGRRWYCGRPLVAASADFTIDHVIPRNRGGTDLSGNLVPACRTCNTLKGTGTIEELREKLAARAGRVQPPPGLIAVARRGWTRETPRRMEPRDLYEFHFERAGLKP